MKWYITHNVIILTNRILIVSVEPDLNQRPPDICYPLQSGALPTELSTVDIIYSLIQRQNYKFRFLRIIIDSTNIWKMLESCALYGIRTHKYIFYYILSTTWPIRLNLSPAGFEPAHPKITELKSVALDHSAMMTWGYHLMSVPTT
jgi:hypothetical protein